MMPPTACKFWPQGICRYGDQCRFEHVRDQGLRNDNRFNVLQHSSANPRNMNGSRNPASLTRQLPYSLDKNSIITDLTTERPQWILSAYGPGRQAPAQLFGGYPREQSFEEMRLLHYMVASNPQQLQSVILESDNLFKESEKQIQLVLSKIDSAIDYLINAEKQHPNRVDICRESTRGNQSINPFKTQSSLRPTPTSNPFSGAQTPQAIVINQPSTVTFGEQSALAFVPKSVPTFGQSSTPSFGAPTPTQGPFGQVSNLSQASNPFGPIQPALGACTLTSSAFGNPSVPNTTQNLFGGGPVTKTSFGQPSGSLSNPFDRGTLPPQSTSCPFGGPSPNSTNPFATFQKPNSFSFGSSGSQQHGFSTESHEFSSHFQNQSRQNLTHIKPLPPSSEVSSALNAADPVLQPTSMSPSEQSNPSELHPKIETYSSKDANGRLTMFKGRRVMYKEETPWCQTKDGSWEKIWFPNGKPPFCADSKMSDSVVYDDATTRAYAYAGRNKVFEGGVIPFLPPKEDWCRWDF